MSCNSSRGGACAKLPALPLSRVPILHALWLHLSPYLRSFRTCQKMALGEVDLFTGVEWFFT